MGHNKIVTFLIFALVFTFFAVVNIQAYSYEIEYYSTNTTMVSGTINTPSILKDENCQVTQNIRGYLIGSSFDVGVNYFSPDNVQIGTALKTNKNVIVCSTFGEYSTTEDLGNYYESYGTYTTTATNGNITLTTTYQCEETNIYYDVLGDMSEIDSFGNVVSRYASVGGTYDASYYDNTYSSNNNNCFSGLSSNPPMSASISGSSCIDYRKSVYAYYPFNSGTEGIVKYDINLGNSTDNVLTCSDSCTGSQKGYANLYIVKASDETQSLLYSKTIDCAGSNRIDGNISGSLSLDPNEDYFITFASYNDDNGIVCPCSRSYTHKEPRDFNISVYVYDPDWNCTGWGECIDSEQLRICHDLNGIAIPKTEFRTCDVGVIENATLGFEEFTTLTDVLRCEPQHITGCPYVIQNISVDRPKDWTVVDPAIGKQYFISMASEWATEGSRSVKLWFQPPRNGEVIDASTCGNLTTGRLPQIYQNVSNTTFSVNHNVTFPYDNMIIEFDTKKCDNQVLHHSAVISTFFGINLTTICNKNCYASPDKCEDEPRGRYFFNIVDTVTSQSLLGTPFFDEAESLTKTPRFDLSGLGIIPGRVYNIVFAVFPENLNDASGDCVLFDNLKYYTTENDLTTIVGADCESRCDGTTRIDSRKLSNGNCLIVEREFSPLCIDEETAESIENLENFCSDSTTLQRFNELTAKYDEISCDFVCEDGRCITEDEEDDIITDEELKSTGLVDGFLAIFNFEINLGILNFIKSDFMLGIYFIFIVMIIIIRLTESWQIGAMSMFVMFVSYVFGSLIPGGIGFLLGAGIVIGLLFLLKKGS